VKGWLLWARAESNRLSCNVFLAAAMKEWCPSSQLCFSSWITSRRMGAHTCVFVNRRVCFLDLAHRFWGVFYKYKEKMIL
jgi:hypothetical protein